MTVKITVEVLRKIAPTAAEPIIQGIVQNQDLLPRYGIDNTKRVAHFLGQIACESAGFTRLEENMNYTTTKRLRTVWPNRFTSDAKAKPFVRNPEKLANFVYSSRLGNGQPASGDGWRYRGSGLKQTTGKANFQAVERETGLPVVAHPEMLRRFPEALHSACIYWRDNRLNRFADASDVKGLTRAVQGGAGGLAERRTFTKRAMEVSWEQDTDVAIETAATRRPLLKRDAKGEHVVYLRQVLTDLGYDVDGPGPSFGPKTEDAVKKFQESQGIDVDGRVGRDTWAMLDLALVDRKEPPVTEEVSDLPEVEVQEARDAIPPDIIEEVEEAVRRLQAAIARLK
jgi:putative chitinase